MTRSAPFAKKPSSQYQKQEFYWRGNDHLKEKEYLIDEFKKARADYNKAQMEYKIVEQEIAKQNETLYERESYTTVLASCLDNDAEGSEKEAEYKKRIAELELEIQKAEEDLAEAKAVHHPAVLYGLQKEKAYLTIEIQRQSKALGLRGEEICNNKKQLAACTVSDRYQRANDLESENEKLARKRAFLRSQVNKKKEEFDRLASLPNVNTRDNKEERSAAMQAAEVELVRDRLKERDTRRVNKWNMEVNRLLRQIEELNGRMKDLHMKDQMVDVEPLREKYIIKRESENKEESKDEEKEE